MHFQGSWWTESVYWLDLKFFPSRQTWEMQSWLPKLLRNYADFIKWKFQVLRNLSCGLTYSSSLKTVFLCLMISLLFFMFRTSFQLNWYLAIGSGLLYCQVDNSLINLKKKNLMLNIFIMEFSSCCSLCCWIWWQWEAENVQVYFI